MILNTIKHLHGQEKVFLKPEVLDKQKTKIEGIKRNLQTFQFSSAQSLSHVQLFVTLWTAACWASLSITNSQSLLKLMSIESVMPSSHLILCHPLLLLPSLPASVFSNETFTENESHTFSLKSVSELYKVFSQQLFF